MITIITGYQSNTEDTYKKIIIVKKNTDNRDKLSKIRNNYKENIDNDNDNHNDKEADNNKKNNNNDNDNRNAMMMIV